VQREVATRVGIPSTKLATAYNSCDVTAIHERAASASPSSSDGPVIGMVARLNEIKDQQALIRALPYVQEAYPHAELWLVGDGARRGSLESLTHEMNLQEQVRFLGNRDDVPDLLGKMDVFALITTGAEGLPLVLTEALAAGLPVVATDVGPCAEVLRDGEWGALVRAKDPRAVADGILKALDGAVRPPDLREVRARYDNESSAKEYWELLFDEEPQVVPT
jgi:glycosyltransferase involved in cell wall biosynthesis